MSAVTKFSTMEEVLKTMNMSSAGKGDTSSTSEEHVKHKFEDMMWRLVCTDLDRILTQAFWGYCKWKKCPAFVRMKLEQESSRQETPTVPAKTVLTKIKSGFISGRTNITLKELDANNGTASKISTCFKYCAVHYCGLCTCFNKSREVQCCTGFGGGYLLLVCPPEAPKFSTQ